MHVLGEVLGVHGTAERGEARDIGKQDGGLLALLLGRRHGMQRGKPRSHRREASLDNGIA